MHPDLVHAMTRQYGLFTVQQAKAAGYDHRDIAIAIRSRAWVRVRRGVLSTADLPSAGDEFARAREEHIRVAAADYLNLRTTRAVALSHETAAALHDVKLLGTLGDTRPSLTMPPNSPSVTAASHVHRAALPSDAVVSRDSLPCTAPARTVVDLARSRPFRDAVAAVDSALNQRRVTAESLARLHAVCGRWPGASRARRVLDFADGLAESPYESLARVLCVEQGVPRPTPQLQVTGADGHQYWCDLGWEEEWTVLEVDGFTKYVTRKGNDPDRVHFAEKVRSDMIVEAGYELVRVTPLELVRRGTDVGPRVFAAMARARRRHGRHAS